MVPSSGIFDFDKADFRVQWCPPLPRLHALVHRRRVSDAVPIEQKMMMTVMIITTTYNNAVILESNIRAYYVK